MQGVILREKSYTGYKRQILNIDHVSDSSIVSGTFPEVFFENYVVVM
jgi:hypothetical protein